MTAPEPQKEHQWLQKMVGDWIGESECSVGPDQPSLKTEFQESIRSLGGLWVIAEGRSEGPDGTEHWNIMTLGYDPQKQRFVGTFIASMMTNLWVYEGTMDESGSMVTLDTVGPRMDDPAQLSNYQDIVEFRSADERLLRSRIQLPDGSWQDFMTATYRRKK